jgi:hypothetical protein
MGVMTLDEFVEQAPLRDLRVAAELEKCTECGVPLQEAIAGYRKTDKGPHCSDCFFDAFSDLVDMHPIGKPMSTRGHAA